MKKLLIIFSLTITFLMLLTSCTLDIGEDIDSSMENITTSIEDAIYPFFKEDEKHSQSDSSTDSDSETDNETPEINFDDYEYGTEVGNICPSGTLKEFNGNGLLSNDVDFSQSGKVAVVNFWGVWCPYCLDELPYFDAAATEYDGKVNFYAIHTDDRFSTDGGGIDYVNANYKSSKITFLKDENSTGQLDDCYTALGGDGYYPYTVILDEFGIITYKATGKISEQTLIEEIEKALAKYEAE